MSKGQDQMIHCSASLSMALSTKKGVLSLTSISTRMRTKRVRKSTYSSLNKRKSSQRKNVTIEKIFVAILLKKLFESI